MGGEGSIVNDGFCPSILNHVGEVKMVTQSTGKPALAAVTNTFSICSSRLGCGAIVLILVGLQHVVSQKVMK